ncbi:MAG: nuclear transport factor 2 family protein [Clostridiales bacterium]|nr:nuclear transport factor 2 family protein [Clostridiales bacterium]
MKKRMFARFFLMGLLLLFVVSGAGCSVTLSHTQEAMPEDTLEAFEDAVNAMDTQAMLDCMDEDAVSAMTSGMDILMNIAGKVTGVDLGISAEDLINVMPLLQAMLGDQAGEMEYPEVDFQVTETRIKGDKATVFFDEVNSGESGVINMEKEDGKWYIVLDTKLISRDEADQIIVPGEEEVSGGEEDDREYIEFSILDLFSKDRIKEFLEEILG